MGTGATSKFIPYSSGCLRWTAAGESLDTPGTNTRSLGTVSNMQIVKVQLQERSGERRYRLSFTDCSDSQYDAPISDLAFRAFLNAEMNRLGSSLAASQQTTRLLEGAERLYLRLGLARPWRNPNTNMVACWMQITGIYTFPDYLEGRSFTDF